MRSPRNQLRHDLWVVTPVRFSTMKVVFPSNLQPKLGTTGVRFIQHCSRYVFHQQNRAASIVSASLTEGSRTAKDFAAIKQRLIQTAEQSGEERLRCIPA